MSSSSLSDSNDVDIGEAVIISTLQRENKRLEAENRDLVRQNSVLKNQFENAIKRAENMEKYHILNKQLDSDINDLKTKKNEIENRLKIALKTIDEMKRRLVSTKQEGQLPIASIPSKIEKLDNNVLNDKLNSAEKIATNERNQRLQLQAQMDQLIQIGSQSFGLNINSTSALIEAMLRQATLKCDMEKLELSNNKLKSKNKRLKIQIKEIDQAFANSSNSLKDELQKNKAFVNTMKMKNQILQKSLDELLKQKENLEQSRIQLQEKIQTNENEFKTKLLEKRIDPEAKKNQKLLKACELENKKKTEEIRALTSSNITYKSQIDTLTQKLATVANKADKWKSRCRSLSDQLMEAKAEYNQPIIDTVNQAEMNRLIAKNSELESLLAKARHDYNSIEKRNIQYEDDIQRYLIKIKEFKRLLKESEKSNEIPPNTWSICDIPRDVFEYINEVSRNPSTPIPLKISQILNSLIDYYKNIIKKNIEEKNDAQKVSNNVSEKLSSLCSYIGRLFSNVPVNFAQLHTDEKAREVLSSEVKNLFLDRKSLSENRKDVSDFLGTIGADSLVEASNAVFDLIKEVKRNKKVIKKLQKEIANHENSELELSKRLKKVEAANVIYKQAAEDAEKEKDVAMKRVVALTNEVESLRVPPQPDFTSEIQDLKRRNLEFDSICSELEAKLAESDSALQVAQHDLSVLAKKYEDSQHTIEMLKDQLNQTEDFAEAQLVRAAKKIKSLKKTSKAEKEKLMDSLKKVTSEGEAALVNIRNRCHFLEGELSKESQEKAELTVKCRTLQTQLSAAHANNECAAKQAESRATARAMAEIGHIKQQLEDCRAEADAAKKTMVQELATAFPFAAENGEDNYQNIIGAVRARFDGLTAREAAVRTALGISPRASIESAIAEMKDAMYERTEV